MALLLVSLLFLVLQLAFVPRPFGLSTDEATYLAKVDPSAPELYWTQPRAWGTALLAAPVALFAPGLTAVRVYFGLLSSAGLVAAFWPWLRVFRPGVAPLAALLFSTTWFTLYNGPLVMPNLYVALAAVAAIGMFLRAVDSPRWWRIALCGAAAALVALVRPPDSVVLFAPVLACALVVTRLRRARVLAALAGGVVIGWVPWVVEAYLLFGGLVARLRTAETTGPGGLSLHLANLSIYPRLLDGTPIYCCRDGGPPIEAGPVPWLYASWLVAVAVLALIGLLVAARQGQLSEMLMVGLPAGSLAGFYLLLPGFTALRYLLPALALVALPVAALLVTALTSARSAWSRAISVALVAALLIGHLGLMVPQAKRDLERDARGRKQPLLIAHALRPIVRGRPCLVLGKNEPQATSYYLKCRVQTARPTRRPPQRVIEAQAEGRVIVAVLNGRPSPGSYMASWQKLSVTGLPRGMEAYIAPD